LSPLSLDLSSVGSQRDDVGVSCERRLVGHSTNRLKIQCTQDAFWKAVHK
jgi:hypothetical protein